MLILLVDKNSHTNKKIKTWNGSHTADLTLTLFQHKFHHKISLFFFSSVSFLLDVMQDERATSDSYLFIKEIYFILVIKFIFNPFSSWFHFHHVGSNRTHKKISEYICNSCLCKLYVDSFSKSQKKRSQNELWLSKKESRMKKKTNRGKYITGVN